MVRQPIPPTPLPIKNLHKGNLLSSIKGMITPMSAVTAGFHIGLFAGEGTSWDSILKRVKQTAFTMCLLQGGLWACPPPSKKNDCCWEEEDSLCMSSWTGIVTLYMTDMASCGLVLLHKYHIISHGGF